MDLRECLHTVLQKIAEESDPSVHEVEIRLGYKDDKFVSNIGRNNYSKLIQLLHTNTNWSSVKKVKQTDYFSNDLRLSVTEDTQVCVKKTRKQTWDFPFYNDTNWHIRMSWCTEEPVCDEEFGEDADFCREKTRMRFVHTNKYGMSWNYDMTIVQNNTSDDDMDEDKGDQMYEFELELCLDNIQHTNYLADSTVLKVNDMVSCVS